MQDVIVVNGTVVTLGDENRIVPGGAVVIKDGLVKEVGPQSEFAGKYPGARLIDARGGLVMPGFVNAHTHFYGAFARGMPFEGPAPTNFHEILQRVWWRIDKALNMEDVRYSALLGSLEAVRRGTTTLIDHHASPNAVAGSLDAVAKVTLEAGLRACLCYEVSDRDGSRIAQAGVDENERFIEKCRTEWADNSRIAAAFGLHASFTVDDATLEKTAAVVKKHDAPIHVHVAEGTTDAAMSVEKYQARPIARLDHHGLLDRPALLAHCIDLTLEEREVLAARKTWLLHNPQSNMNNAVGTLPICPSLDLGIRVALGTDGFGADMLTEMRVLGLIHKAMSLDPRTLGLDKVYQVSMLESARLASSLLGIKVGALEVGAAGDCVVLDYAPPTPFTPDNFLGHLFFGMPGSHVRTTIAGGQVLMLEGEFQTLDEAAITARSRELAPLCWQRME